MFLRELRVFVVLFLLMFVLLALIGFNVYFANLHSHTEYSDGQGLPLEAYTYARDTARIDVLAITDHTHYLSPAGYLQQRGIADEFNRQGGFVALAGQEFGSLAQFGHFSIYDAGLLCPISTGDLTGFYRWLAGLREPAQFNHPSLEDFEDFRYDRAADDYVTTIEVFNGSGLYTPVNEDKFLAALRSGWHCAPVANQDNHRRKWGNWYNDEGKIALTGIWADTLTTDAILAAILARRVYAMEVKPESDRISLLGFSIGAVPMGSQGTVSDSLVVMSVEVSADSAFRQLYLYRNGELFDSMLGSGQSRRNPVWTRSVPVTNDYYFVKGVQTDGDRFWTAPIWLSYKGPARTLEFYPNPFSNLVRISFSDDDRWTEFHVFDAAGTEVYHRWNHEFERGPVLWDGRTDGERNLPNGVYYVRVAASDVSGRSRSYVGKVAIKR